VDDRLEAVRQVIRAFDMGDEWEAATDDELPAPLAELTPQLIDAYRRVDLDWLLEHTDPGVEIVQLQELPDSRSYSGRDGFIEALLDWPRQWDDFRMEPRRIFAADDEHLLIVAIHRGRPHSMDIDVEAEIVFLMRWEAGRMTSWDMFLTVDEALGRAAERGAHRHDDHAAQGDRRE
jgi:ketosteroid isomerase-like protein